VSPTRCRTLGKELVGEGPVSVMDAPVGPAGTELKELG